jgi:hypothetical protein
VSLWLCEEIQQESWNYFIRNQIAH